jgi:hypothetical protein
VPFLEKDKQPKSPPTPEGGVKRLLLWRNLKEYEENENEFL